MVDTYILEEVQEQGTNRLAVLEGDQYTLGRDDEESTIVIRNSAISRRHGELVRRSGYWLYRDLGSTNGSWINSVRLRPQRWRLLRPGDVLQLADVGLQIAEADASGKRAGHMTTGLGKLGTRSLLVFADDALRAEFPVPEYGRALVIGGSNPDLPLEGDLFEQPSLIAERRGENVVVYSVVKEFPITVNGQEIRDVVNIKDGDEICISGYTILYNEPAGAQLAAPTATAGQGSTGGNLRGWTEPEARPASKPSLTGARMPVRNPVFGQKPVEEEGDETFALELNEMRTPPYGRGVRGGAGKSGKREYSLTSLEDKVILIIGFTLLLALVALMILWALKA